MTTTASGDAAMRGKVCLVTGATGGIGLIASRSIARMGAEVVMLGRDPARTEAAADSVRGDTGNPAVSVLIADLSSQAEVRRAAREFVASGRPLHVLLNNAGAINQRRTETVDGIETTLAVNHLAYFLLTTLLLPRLRESAPARVVNVASAAHRWAADGIHFDDPQFRRWYLGPRVYGHSKLANILFTRELARRTAGTGVTATCVHPGYVATGFARNNGLVANALMDLGRLIARTPEEGAETVVWLCSSPEVEGQSGGYYFDRRERRPLPAARDDSAARRLWALSEEMTAKSTGSPRDPAADP